MANKALDIVVKVIDAASGKLREINKSFDNTGKVVKKTAVDFTEFNRTMFSTTAFAGLFQRAFSGFSGAILEGAQLDRVQEQFENVLGPSGKLFQAIKSLTGTSIDRVEAMRAGIALSTLKVTKDLGQVAEIIARSGTAAKMAGLDAGEGVKHFTQFIKTGSMANLEFLNLIRGSDPAFKMQMAIMEKAGGVMGSAMTAQEKYTRGMLLLRMATRNMSKDNRDLLDITTELGQSFKFFKGEIGTFLGNALSPLLIKLADLFDSWSLQLQLIQKNDKDLKFLGKAFIYVTGAVTGLVAVLGTLRLAVKALTFVGVGVPSLIKLVAILAAGFIALTNNADKMKEKITGPFDNLLNRLKLVGGFFRGIYQLFTSFFDPDNFVRGIGKIDTALYEMLDQAGLLGFVVALARVASVVRVFGQSVIDEITKASKWINDKLGGAFEKVLSMLGLAKGEGQSWSRVLIDNTNSVHKALAKLTAGFIALWAASKVFKSIGGLLSHIPVIGGIFGSKGNSAGRGPKGTRGDPIFTSNADKLNSFVMGKLGLQLQNLALRIPFLANMLTHPKGKLIGLLESIAPGIKTFFKSPASLKDLFGIKNLPKLVNSLLSKISSSPSGVMRAVASLRGVGSGVMGGIGEVFGAIRTFAGALLGRIPQILALWMLFKAGSGIVKSLIDNFESWKNLGSAVVDWLSSSFRLAKAKIEEFFTNLPTVLSGMWDTVQNAGAEAWSGLKGFFQEHFGAMFDGVKEKVSAGLDWLDEFTRATPIIRDFRNSLAEAGNFIKNMFLAIFTGIMGVIKNIPLVGDTLEWAYKELGDFAAGMADIGAKRLNQATISQNIQTIQTTGVVTKSLLPETSEGRHQVLQQAATEMFDMDRGKSADIARAMREALVEGGISAEEFANALGAKLDEGLSTKAQVQAVIELKKQNNKSSINNKPRTGGCG